MANNYTLFAAAIRDTTREERDWLTEVLRADPSEEGGRTFLKSNLMLVLCGEWPGFEWAVCGPTVEIWSEENGDLENVAVVMRKFLRKFRPGATWGMEWAVTCSRPCIGEFGGGAMVVTADDVRWLSTSKWMHDVMEDGESWPREAEEYD